MPRTKSCVYCLAAMSKDTLFCPSCGHPVKDLPLALKPGQHFKGKAYSSETVIGYTSNVGFRWFDKTSGIVLFTTERMVAAKAHGLRGSYRLSRDYLETGLSVDVNELLFQHEQNFAIPYSEMLELRVRKPGWFYTGKVTVRTALGTTVLHVFNRHLYKQDWAFLKSPPPQLAGKVIVT